MARFEIIAECVVDTEIDLESIADEYSFDMLATPSDCDPLGDDVRVGSRLSDGFSLLLGSEL